MMGCSASRRSLSVNCGVSDLSCFSGVCGVAERGADWATGFAGVRELVVPGGVGRSAGTSTEGSVGRGVGVGVVTADSEVGTELDDLTGRSEGSLN